MQENILWGKIFSCIIKKKIEYKRGFKMKKKALLLGLCGCLMLSVVACGKKSGLDVTLGQYKGIEVTVEPVEITEEDVNKQLENFNNQKGKDVKITDRTDVRDGDTVNIDYVGKIDGKEFDGGKDEGYNLKIGSKTFIDGFESGLVGKNVGETVDVPVTFPNPYDSNPDLAGKEAVFTVTVNYLTDGKKEPLTDEVVKQNSDYETIDAYKDYIKTSLTKNAEQAAQTQKEIDIIQKAIDNTTFKNLEQKEFDTEEADMRAYYTSAASQYGVDLKTYILYVFGMTEEQFNAEIKKAAEFNVKQRLMLDEVVKAEKLEITDEEYTEKVTEYAEQNSFKTVEEFEEAYKGKENVKIALLREKALDLVIDSAVVK
ncbi:MAG TPA: trigger factor [Lachnoclostridium phytofermentans]|uniref:Trigger factor n=2 Tax=Lachnoclostridium TaxID=1506553 RepID=A0A3D2X492_9FIRM|nr:trigger factor [Lachnoclostridium phytofermentans]